MRGVSMRAVWGLLLAAGCLFAQGPVGWEREPIRDIRVRIDGQWVLAGQGRDETAQMVQVRIWGPVLDPSTIIERPLISPNGRLANLSHISPDFFWSYR